jgi:hypothetical protein
MDTPNETPACTLPSAQSACDLVHGRGAAAIPDVVVHTLFRAALIGLGVRLAGERDLRRAATYGLAGAVTIEAFVLAWTAGPGRVR